jgi:hypothetical protein
LEAHIPGAKRTEDERVEETEPLQDQGEALDD